MGFPMSDPLDQKLTSFLNRHDEDLPAPANEWLQIQMQLRPQSSPSIVKLWPQFATSFTAIAFAFLVFYGLSNSSSVSDEDLNLFMEDSYSYFEDNNLEFGENYFALVE